MPSDIPLSFVLVSHHAYPDPTMMIQAAHQMGVGLTHAASDGTAMHFDIATGGTLFVALMPAPHPDAATMATGPTSPDAEVIHQHTGHYIVTALGLADGSLPPETFMGIVTAAVIKSSPAVAAMLGSGIVFHRADIFAGLVEAAGHDIPTAITVDITAERESEDRMSFLTHGLNKYGREEFFVTASITGQGAIEYLMVLVNWMVVDPDKVLPTGDTVGRTAEEKILVQRVPSPIEGRPDVIRLDMDVDTNPGQSPKKKGWFRKN